RLPLLAALQALVAAQCQAARRVPQTARTDEAGFVHVGQSTLPGLRCHWHRTCHECGFVVEEGISVAVREWDCPHPACACHHLREILWHLKIRRASITTVSFLRLEDQRK